MTPRPPHGVDLDMLWVPMRKKASVTSRRLVAEATDRQTRAIIEQTRAINRGATALERIAAALEEAKPTGSVLPW